MPSNKAPVQVTPVLATVMAPIESPVAVNHLFLGRSLTAQQRNKKKNRTVVQAPTIAALYDVKPAAAAIAAPQDAQRCSAASAANQNIVSIQAGGASEHHWSGLTAADRCLSGLTAADRCLSVQSVESEVSATCSSHRDSLSTRSDSTSDVSTVCGDSCDVTAREAITSTAKCDDVFDDHTDAPPSSGKEVNQETGEIVVADSSRTSIDDGVAATTSEDASVCTASLDESKSNVKLSVNPDNCDITTEDGSQTSADLENHVKVTHASQASENNDVNASQIIDVMDKISKMIDEPSAASNVKDVSQSQDQHRSRSMIHHHVHPRDYDVSDDDDDDSSTCSSLSPYERSPRHGGYASTALRNNNATHKQVFNPFPSQHVSSRRAQNGVKLGLYPAGSVPKLELGILRSRPLQTIGRQQINTCLHRQYMAEVKNKVK